MHCSPNFLLAVALCLLPNICTVNALKIQFGKSHHNQHSRLSRLHLNEKCQQSNIDLLPECDDLLNTIPSASFSIIEQLESIDQSSQQRTSLLPSFLLLATVLATPPTAKAISELTIGQAAVSSDFSSTVSYIQSYWRYFLSGSICCSFSHGISVPFDVIKTKKQVQPELASLSIIDGFKKVIADDGLSVMFKGMQPTLIGYAIQGGLKYGFYEAFKPIVKIFLQDHGIEGNQLLQFALASIAAETIGATVLAPSEAARIRMVTIPSYGKGLLDTLQTMVSREGVGSLFNSLPIIFSKSLPYTAVQLTSFEFTSSYLYQYLLSTGVVDVSPYRFYVTLISSFVAAFLSTIASQPGDTLLTILNKESAKLLASSSSSASSSGSSAVAASGKWAIFFEKAKQLQPPDYFVGIQARLLHVGVIVVVQLLVYDYVKQLCGVPLIH